MIHLIASGATAWQAENRLQGDTDLPLSDDGLTQIQAAAADWSDPKVRTLYCAPDEASRQTADAFAARLDDPRIKSLSELAEMNLGLWQGLQISALRERYPRAYAQWRQQPDAVNIPEGESLIAASDRIRTCVAKLIDKAASRPIALILRPVTLGLCRAWLQGRPPAEFRSDKTPCPIVTTIPLDPQTLDRIRSTRSGRRIPA